ncbi:MAG: hypothetical protein ACRD3E_14030 [Terriglobales bacterium]
MSAEDMHEAPRCQHVRLRGKECLAPARRGTKYCLFHEAEHRDEEKLTFPPIEDGASVAVATDQVIKALKHDIIDYRRAALLFAGLRLARINLRQLGLELGDMPDPTLANPAMVGHPKISKQEEELEKEPSLAEILLERLSALEEETAREEGMPAPEPYDIEGARARGLNDAEMLLERLRGLEVEEEDSPRSYGETEERTADSSPATAGSE